MLNQNINPATVPFVELDAIMKAKAELTIKFAVNAIDSNVEELHQMVDGPVPPLGCSISDRVKRHHSLKKILTRGAEWFGDIDNGSDWGCFWVVGLIHSAKDEAESMLVELRKLVGQKLSDQSRQAVTESINELEHIQDNLANEPDDPRYAEIVS